MDFFNNLFKGGFLKNKKTTVMIVVAGVAAFGAYLVGDMNLVNFIQTVTDSL